MTCFGTVLHDEKLISEMFRGAREGDTDKAGQLASRQASRQDAGQKRRTLGHWDFLAKVGRAATL